MKNKNYITFQHKTCQIFQRKRIMRIGLIISKKKINKSEKLAEKDLIELFSQNNNRQDLIQLMMLTQIDILI